MDLDRAGTRKGRTFEQARTAMWNSERVGETRSRVDEFSSFIFLSRSAVTCGLSSLVTASISGAG